MIRDPLLDWYVVQMRPNAGGLAVNHLHNQGYATFMPRIARNERRNGTHREMLRPLFPGYLFAGVPSDKDWRQINSTRGVSRIVTFGGRPPSPVQPSIISALQLQVDENDVFTPDTALVAGDKVRILSGPLHDFVATLHQLDDAQRAWVLLDILGKETRIELPRRLLLSV